MINPHMPHIHKYIDFVSVAYIVHKNKVLLVDHIKYNMWLPVGGHVELTEDPEQALYREVEEECGLEIEVLGTKLPEIAGDTTKPLIAPQYMDIHDITEKHKHVVFVYFAESKTDACTLAPREHRSFKWFTAEELQDPALLMKPSIRRYAKEALKRI